VGLKREAIVGARRSLGDRVRRRDAQQAAQETRDQAGDPQVHAQVLGQVEEDLETEHPLGERGKERAPGDPVLVVERRVLGSRTPEQRLDVLARVAVEGKVRRAVLDGDDRLVAPAEDRGQIETSPVGLEHRAPFAGLPVTVRDRDFRLEPGAQQELQEAPVRAGPVARQGLQQQLHPLSLSMRK